MSHPIACPEAFRDDKQNNKKLTHEMSHDNAYH